MSAKSQKELHPPLAVRTVAVIGAGISGVVTAAHLKEAGLTVTVYERGSQVGGVWIYDPRPPLEPRYPAVRPSEGENVRPEELIGLADKSLLHAPPGPCYASLHNNVPTSLVCTSLHDWPAGTPDRVPHTVLKQYIEDCARASGVLPLIEFATRVVSVDKDGDSWSVKSVTLNKDESGWRESEKSKSFDAVVVASGHYHAPFIPDTPGLANWKAAWPSRISHSKRYRTPDIYKDKTVLLIGGGVSAVDIASDIAPIARHVYQSTRNGPFDLSAAMLPANATRVSEVLAYEASDSHDGSDGDYDTDEASSNPSSANGTTATEGSEGTGSATNQRPSSNLKPGQPLAPDAPLPGRIRLSDGQDLCGIDAIILCTGYQMTYPFLSQFHSDTAPAFPQLQSPTTRSTTVPKIPTPFSPSPTPPETTLVTSSPLQTHHLHRDIFYIPDPTLAFIGVPYYTATFSCFDFQAQALAYIFSGRARLPATQVMREEYQNRIVENLKASRIAHVDVWAAQLNANDEDSSNTNDDNSITKSTTSDTTDNGPSVAATNPAASTIVADSAGRTFHSLRGKEVEYVTELFDWINSQAPANGFGVLVGHDAEWVRKREEFSESVRGRFSGNVGEKAPKATLLTCI